MAFLPKDEGHSSLMLLFYFGGRIFSESAAYTCWFYTAELYPTNLRSQALGLCSSSARVFGMSSAFIPKLATVWGPLPMLLICVPTTAAGLMARRLPETKDASLPETLEEAMMLDFRGGKAQSGQPIKMGNYVKVSQDCGSEGDSDFEVTTT